MKSVRQSASTSRAFSTLVSVATLCDRSYGPMLNQFAPTPDRQARATRDVVVSESVFAVAAQSVIEIHGHTENRIKLTTRRQVC
jgi:hypothetical protein